MVKTAKEMAGTSVLSYDFSRPDVDGYKIPKIQIRSYRISSNMISNSRDGNLGSAAKDAISNALNAGNYDDVKSLAGRTREPSASITLPIPDNLKFSSEFDWSAEGKSLLATTVGSFNADQSAKQEVEGAEGLLAGILGRTIGNIETLGGDMILQNMGLYSDAMKELYFRGHNHRRFNWTWELIPRNAQEAEAMMKCVRKLRIDAHPEKFARGLNILPCEFEVSFLNAKLPTVGKLICTLADSDYGDLGPSPRFTKDNYPASIKLAVNLMELELLDREMLERSEY
uniref:Baseplate tail tube cap n=1 Tax=Ochrobactrum phage ORM_20 TaxID=2985243 RepID=A0A9N6WVH0_9VIRU|nr:baseplate tail tube cap [Ochrobactrum phage ORM_20]